MDSDQKLVRFANWLALFVVVLIALGAPAAYFFLGYQRISASLAGEINFKTRQVSQLIGGNPEYWQFEGLRIGELIVDDGDATGLTLNRVVDKKGEVVVQQPTEAPDLGWPTISAQRSLMDYGVPVGRIEIVRSLRDLLQQTTLVAIVCLLLGALVSWGLRAVPLQLLQRAWNRVTYLANYDTLTGLPNRTLFLDRLEHALAGESRPSTFVAVYAIDLDRFKDINDSLGYAAGDALLKHVAERLRACLRRSDTLARVGGDEFAIVQGGIDELRAAATLAERVLATFVKPFKLDGQDISIRASVGVATSPTDGAIDPGRLFKNAHLALWRSKTEGRYTFCFFQEKMDADLRARKALEVDLRKAVLEEQFELYYQPQFDLDTHRIIGLEALLRWHHPVRGVVPPGEFIPVVESIGLIQPVSEWVLHRACSDAVGWAPLKVAVNLSSSLFKQEHLGFIVDHALKTTGLSAERLELEITEDILMADTDRALNTLMWLKKRGVRIAMDDFGTGYSSLSYLRRFPFDKIKIDRSFIRDIDANLDARAIVRAITVMARPLR